MIEGPRPARFQELPAVIGLSNAVFSPGGVSTGGVSTGGSPGAVDMGQAFPTLFTKDNVENLFIFVDDGSPVALAGITVQDLAIGEAVVRSACIGSVCTREDHRGQGLAACLTDECFAAASAQGASLMLVSGGRGLYRRIGCVDAGLFRVIRLDRGSAFPEVSCGVCEWAESDLEELQALHDRERVRFVRPSGVTASLLRSRTMHARPARTWIARVGGQAAAYLCISGSTIREIAGSRQAILAAAPAILEASGAESLDLEIPASDAEMTHLASAFGLDSRITGMDGTLKITDPRKFFESIQPLMPGSLTVECGDAVIFRAGGESMRVSTDGDMAVLVFGSVERGAPEAGQGRLGKLMRGVYPLPLPGYGLNYI